VKRENRSGRHCQRLTVVRVRCGGLRCDAVSARRSAGLGKPCGDGGRRARWRPSPCPASSPAGSAHSGPGRPRSRRTPGRPTGTRRGGSAAAPRTQMPPRPECPRVPGPVRPHPRASSASCHDIPASRPRWMNTRTPAHAARSSARGAWCRLGQGGGVGQPDGLVRAEHAVPVHDRGEGLRTASAHSWRSSCLVRRVGRLYMPWWGTYTHKLAKVTGRGIRSRRE